MHTNVYFKNIVFFQKTPASEVVRFWSENPTSSTKKQYVYMNIYINIYIYMHRQQQQQQQQQQRQRQRQQQQQRQRQRQRQQQQQQQQPPEPPPPSPPAATCCSSSFGRTNLTKEQHLPFINPTASTHRLPLSEICSFVDVQKSGQQKKMPAKSPKSQWSVGYYS